ncbi:hypothetical protein QBC44DRAFT_364748 [Cladorrhinum sp. PSN332]|nr:hypothetical protein QBC44DRAFT_364748 [Cladorrhinum sp. PSN332]
MAPNHYTDSTVSTLCPSDSISARGSNKQNSKTYWSPTYNHAYPDSLAPSAPRPRGSYSRSRYASSATSSLIYDPPSSDETPYLGYNGDEDTELSDSQVSLSGGQPRTREYDYNRSEYFTTLLGNNDTYVSLAPLINTTQYSGPSSTHYRGTREPHESRSNHRQSSSRHHASQEDDDLDYLPSRRSTDPDLEVFISGRSHDGARERRHFSYRTSGRRNSDSSGPRTSGDRGADPLVIDIQHGGGFNITRGRDVVFNHRYQQRGSIHRRR